MFHKNTKICVTIFIDCWNGEPDKRPTIREIVEKLQMYTIENTKIDNQNDVVTLNNTVDNQIWDVINRANALINNNIMKNIHMQHEVRIAKYKDKSLFSRNI